MILSGRNQARWLLLRFFAAWAVLLPFFTFSAQAGGKPERIKLGSGTYVSIQHWADARNFTVNWNRAGKLAHVNSRWTKMTFNVSSRKSSINGMDVWLCSSVIDHNGSLYISERDIDKTIHPILYPAKVSKPVRTIAIAAGHGGKDPGNMVNKHQEKKYTLLLAKALKEELIKRGFKVVMTRETDKFIDLEPQAAIANRAKADLFVTVHYNAVADTDPKGAETFILTPAGAVSTNGGTPSDGAPGNANDSENMLLAYHVHKNLLQKSGFEDRGIRRARFMVLRHLKMPGILIEGGFMSNPSDAKKIFSASHRKIVARSIADGILTYKRSVERK